MPLLAVTAYDAGLVAGGLVPLAIGIALVAVGLRRRRAAAGPSWTYSGPDVEAGTAAPAADPSAPSWTPAPEPTLDVAPEPLAEPTHDVASEPFQPPDLSGPATSRGTGLLAGGAILIALTLIGAAVLVAGTLAAQRRVTLPTSVLGLARDQAASGQLGKQALSDVPAGLTDPQAAVYGTLPSAILVLAAKAHTSRPSSQLEEFRKAVEKSGGTLRAGRDVEAGKLGGAARCWEGVIGGVRPGVCVFVDRGSLVATIDFLGGGVDAAAKRGRQVREATVSKR